MKGSSNANTSSIERWVGDNAYIYAMNFSDHMELSGEFRVAQGDPMKKVLYSALGALVLLVFATALAPFFIDLNDYKEEIGNQVEVATGRRLSIDGNIELSLLPLPSVSVYGVRFANASNAAAEDMVQLDSVDVRVALVPLLSGIVKIDQVTLVAPMIELERFADGSDNWTLLTAPNGGDAGVASTHVGEGFDLQIDEVAIENGTLTYRQPGLEERIDGIDVQASVKGLTGPFDIEGALAARAVSLEFAAKISSFVDDETRFNLEIETETGEISVITSGAAIFVGGAPRVSAQLDIKAGSVATALAASTGGGELNALLDQPIAISGAIQASATGTDVTDLRVSFGQTKGEGSVTASFAETPTVNGTLAFQAIDFDPFVASITDGGLTEAEPNSTEVETTAFTLPDGIGIHLDVRVDSAVFNGSATRDLHLIAGLEDGVLNLQQLSVQMPGSADFSLIGFVETVDDQPRFTGQAEFSAADARTFTNWLGVDVEPIPEDQLRTLGFSAEIEATPASVNLTRINALADSSRLSGNLDLRIDGRPNLTVEALIDHINFDAYLPPEQPWRGGQAEEGESTSAHPLKLADADVKLSIGEVIYRRTSITDILLDATLLDGTVNIKELSVANFAGITARIEGQIDPARRNGTLSYDLAADDLDGVFLFSDIVPPVPPEALRPFWALGHISGDVSAMIVDATVSVGDVESAIKGSVSGLGSNPTVDIRFDASAAKGVKLIRRFAVDAVIPENVADGPVSLAAAVVGSLDSAAINAGLSFNELEASVDGKWDGSLPNPSVDATVTARAPSYVRLGQVLAPDSPLAKAAKDGPLRLDGTIKGNLLSAETSLTLALAGARIDLTIDLQNPLLDPKYESEFSAQHDNFSTLMTTFGDSDTKRNLGALNVTATMSGLVTESTDAQHTAVFDATLGPTSLRGEVTAQMTTPRPTVSAVITAQDIVLDSYLAAANSAGGETLEASPTSAAPPPSERWSRELIDLSAMQNIDGDLTLKANSIIIKNYRVDNVTVNGTLTNGELLIDRIGGLLSGGKLNVTGSLISLPVPDADLSLTVDGVDVGPLLPKFADDYTVTGVANLNGTFGTRGQSMFELVSNLGGNAVLDVRDGVIGGIDFPMINHQLGDLDSEASYLNLFGAAAVGGQTHITEIAGTFTAVDGVITSDDLRAELDGAHATATLRADLPSWLLAANGEAQLLGHQSAPGIGISFDGPLDTPRVTLRTDALKGHVGRRAVKSIIKRVDPDFLESDAGQLLDAIVGGGAKSHEKPAEEPAQVQESPQPAKERPVEKLLRGLFE